MNGGNLLAGFTVVQTECLVLSRRDHLVPSVVKGEPGDMLGSITRCPATGRWRWRSLHRAFEDLRRFEFPLSRS